MKIAHLILAHANPACLQRLVKKLAHEDAAIYIHLDAKTAIEPFLPIGETANVFFIKNRVKVNWAGFSQVQSTINSFKEILASGVRYDYINLLSGQDYPIKSNSAIHKFFSENPGKAFMQTLSIMDEWQEAIPRITKYHMADYNFIGKYQVERLLNTILPERKLPEALIPMGRSTWFTITSEQVAYILDYIKEHPAFTHFFKWTWGADEIVFHTILYNSQYKKDMVNDNLLYVDWSEGGANPKVLTMEDADKLRLSDKLFARKFNPDTDHKILDYLDQITS